MKDSGLWIHGQMLKLPVHVWSRGTAGPALQSSRSHVPTTPLPVCDSGRELAFFALCGQHCGLVKQERF